MTILDRFRLDERIAIVTGASRGIGKAIAKGLAEAGAQVIVAARDVEQMDKTVSEIETAGGKAIAIPVDITSRESISNVISSSVARFGKIDVLVNNAGIGFHADSMELTDEAWDSIMEVNLRGVWRASQLVARSMRDTGGGSIINIGSMSGEIVNRPQWHMPYGVSKAAVHHLTRSLAAEWAQYNIRVNALAPGYIRTEIASTEYEDYAHYWRDEVPMTRYGSVDEVAPAALYLASEASSFMTGSIVIIDGGYTLW